MRAEEIKESFRRVGLKASRQRLELFKHLASQNCAVTAEKLHQLVEKKGIDFSTVYRNLNTLVAKGVVQVIHAGDGVARFEILRQEVHHHHHLICRTCKKLEVIDKCFVPKSLSRRSFKGFKELSHRLEFEGLCPSCQ